MTIRRAIPGLGALVALSVLVAWTGTRLDSRRAAFRLPDTLVYLPSADRLRPLALGFSACFQRAHQNATTRAEQLAGRR